MTDPLLVLQSLAAGIVPASAALIGFGVVVCIYVLVGGRTYCSWVCPVNMVTDLANWLRRRSNITMGRAPSRSVRYWMLVMALIVSALTGTIAWEWVNPVSMLHRGLFFGIGLGWTAVLVVFLYDLFVAPRGWCGHVCPMGACYSLIGKASLVRVSASARSRCDDCMDCFTVCPEPQVIKPALKGTGSPVIQAANCTNCARCIEVCSKDVFNFTTRFNQTLK
jgi:ferredoxin-type protein NapH